MTDIFCNNLQHQRFQANLDVSEALITYVTNKGKARVILTNPLPPRRHIDIFFALLSPDLVTGDKMAPVVRNLFQIRSQSYFDANIVSLGVLPSICEALHKYGLFSYFDSWFSDSVFLMYSQWKSIVKTKIRKFEVNKWKNFVIVYPSYKLAETCLDLVSPQMFWSISDQYPDLVTCLHVQIRLMGNFGFSACVHWTIKADESLCFVCKEAKDDFLFDCAYFRKNFDSLWSNLDVKASNSSPTDGSQISA